MPAPDRSRTGKQHNNSHSDDGSRNDDPFGVETLRSATLQSWATSPTRLREDAAAERDLTTVGYRDRVCTELIANAADAATADGVDAMVAVWADGQSLHVANTGAPLSVPGVQSLTALRVSAKSEAGQAGVVGRFGVGFSATAAVADRIEIRSRTGSILFDRSRTADAVRDIGLSADDVPVLRLAWPTDDPPLDGYDTEVILHLRPDVSPDDLVADLDAHIADRMLELPVLHHVSLHGPGAGEVGFTVVREPVPGVGYGEHITVTRRSGVDSGGVDSGGVDSGGDTTVRTFRQATAAGTRWVVELDERGPLIRDHDVLRAPTPTDIELTLPARCISDVALTADRRRLHPLAAIDDAAHGYVDLVMLLAPTDRPRMVPGDHLTVGAEDARLTEAVLDALRAHAWVPSIDGIDLVPDRAILIPDLTDQLAAALRPIMSDLVHQDISGPRDRARLRRVGVVELGWAGLVERLAGLERPPRWWHELYAALSPFVASSTAEEFGALPIPRSDGRMHVGARGLYVSDLVDVAPGWIPTVAPQAHHALLERLGVEHLSATDALADEALRALIQSSEDADDDEVLQLAQQVAGVLAADPAAAVPDWIGALLLPDADGDFSPADELLLPDSPILDVLVQDSPFGRVDAGFVAAVGADVVRRIGVGSGFTVLRDDLPVGPDHDLPDEDIWWDSRTEPPDVLVAVRDLDLVDEDRWDQALTLLLDDEEIAGLLVDRDGYTAWWLRHFAMIDGHRLGWYRAPSDTALAGLLDPLDHPRADDLSGALGAARLEGIVDATTLLDHLADPSRTVASGAVIRGYAALVEAVRSGRIDSSDPVVLEGIRTVDGGVHQDAVVVDRPWFVPVVAPATMVLAGQTIDAESAAILADLLGLPLASEVLEAIVVGEGDTYTTDSADATLFAAWSGHEFVGKLVQVHDDLRIEIRGADDAVEEHAVDWWVDDRGVTHIRRRAGWAPR